MSESLADVVHEAVRKVALPEFLLARIAEIEAAAHEFDWTVGNPRAEWGFPDEPVAASGEYPWLEVSPRWMLAECEAKRRIVNRAVEMQPPYASSYQQEVHETLMEDALPALALPFADHPDYDPRWRL